MATLSAGKRRLRVLLVLGLVLMPGAVLSVVTWRLIGQKRELESSRLAERRTLLAARIAQQMLSRLEQERASATGARARWASLRGTGPDGSVLVHTCTTGRSRRSTRSLSSMTAVASPTHTWTAG